MDRRAVRPRRRDVQARRSGRSVDAPGWLDVASHRVAAASTRRERRVVHGIERIEDRAGGLVCDRRRERKRSLEQRARNNRVRARWIVGRWRQRVRPRRRRHAVRVWIRHREVGPRFSQADVPIHDRSMTKTLAAAAAFLIIIPSFAQDRFPDAPGKTELLTVCGECHGAEVVFAHAQTAGEWSETLNRMVQAGAQASDAQWRLIEQYLHGQLAVIRINEANAAEIQAVFEVPESAAQA